MRELRDVMQDIRLALLDARLAAELQEVRAESLWLNEKLREVERANGFVREVPRVHQWTMLSMAYATMVYFHERHRRVGEPFPWPVVTQRWIEDRGGIVGPGRRSDDYDIGRRLRNSLGHGRFDVGNGQFIFNDEDVYRKHRGEDADRISVTLSWSALGETTMFIIGKLNRELYP